MKNTLFYLLFVSAIVALFAFAFSFSQSTDPDGKQIFLDSKCDKCHSVESLQIVSTGKKPVDLSNAGALGTVEVLKNYMLKQGKINEEEHKTKFKGSDEELTALVNWLSGLKTNK